MSSFGIRKTIRGPLPPLPFGKIARAILGARYELSLVICGDSLSARMNKKYRRKNYSPNVLSFPLNKLEGEIFLNVHKAKREAREFNVTPKERLALLFVHGCFHLKGYRHGRKMEREEKRILKAFGF